jgi:outer membrane autotransporter protein
LHRIESKTADSRWAKRLATLIAQKSQEASTAAMPRHPFPRGARFVVSALIGFAVCSIAAPAEAQLIYTTLNYGTTGTFLTGIRGNNIVGNYVIPGSSQTGGLLYNLSTGIWTPFPVPTGNGANFPGAIGSSPYGPSFGSQYGILNAVGSYKTQSSSPYDLSYLYDAAAAPAANLTPLVYPSAPGAQTLNTIAHSTFGNQVVGNYDTRLLTGNAFIYTISTGTYTTNNFPGAVSTTAYGVWANKIAGGYTPPGLGFERGYIYDENTGTWTSYNHPGALVTHFEGITGAGRGGEYNLVADWVGLDGKPHASILHIDASANQTWIDFAVPGATLTSANSIYENQAIGIYVDANGLTNGYVVTIPGIYDPIHNVGVLNISTPNIPALSGGNGDDVVNDGAIRTTAANSSGILSSAYGVISNNGSIRVTGAGSAGVDMNGVYGTLLNIGSIFAAPGSDAIRTGPSATGITIVNDGIIDGPVAVASADTRFENSGWLGVSAPGAGTAHVINGTFVQTSTGTLALRIAPGQNDLLNVTGHATLGGTLRLIATNGFQPKIADRLSLVIAGGGISGEFVNVLDPFSPVITLELVYGQNILELEFGSDFASFARTPNQRAAGNLLDQIAFNPKATELSSFLFKEPVSNISGDLEKIAPDGLSAFYEISFSGANIQRLNLENRLEDIRNDSGGENVTGGAVYLEDKADGKSSKNPPMLPPVREKRWDFWSTSFGDFVHVDSDFNARGYKFTTGGIDLGIDYRLTDHLAFGLMGSYAHTWSDLRPGSIDVDSGRGGLYATYFNRCFYLNGGIYGGYNSYDSSRRGLQGNANGNSDGAEFSTFVSGGYDFHLGHLTVGPIASLQYTNVYLDGFSEKGSLAPLSIHSDSEESLRSDVGFRASYQWQVGTVHIEPFLKATWEHEFKYSTLPITAGFADISGPSATFLGPSEGHDSAVVDAGISVSWTPRISTYVSYNGLLGRDRYNSNGVSGGVRISF